MSKSRYWKYFEKNAFSVEDKTVTAKCTLCERKVSLGGVGKSANTSNLKHHLQRFHERQYEECSKGNDVTSKVKSAKPLVQASITEAFKQNLPWEINSSRAQQFTFLIGEMIAIDNQPFSIVNDIGFQRLLKKALPAYIIPSDKYFREKILPEIYEKCKHSIQQKISKMTGKMSLTSDIWTSRHNNQSFLSLTSHWLDGDHISERCSFVLACKHFSGAHTGEAIKKALLSLLTDWDIKTEQIHLLIIDNAANMKKGVTEAQINYEPCFIHSLQLVIKDSINAQRSVIDVIAKSRRIVTHFNHSAAACDKFTKIQEELDPNLTPKKLIQDIETRWNSTYYMLERLLELKNAINFYIANSPVDFMDLTFSQWELVKSILNLLKPFEEITKILSSTNCCISEVIPFVSTLKSYLNKSGDSNFSGVGTMKTELLANIDKRFSSVFSKGHYTISTFLDPRFKGSFFDENRRSSVVATIKDVILQNQKCNLSSESPAVVTFSDSDHSSDDDAPLSRSSVFKPTKPKSPCPPNKRKKTEECHSLFWKSYEEFVGAGSSSNSSNSDKESLSSINFDKEVFEYSSLSAVPRTQNPFEWWAGKKNLFPLLYSVAEVYLSAPAGSVASEQLFSEAGKVCESARNRLTPDRAESLIFLHHNLPKLNYSY